MSSIPFSIIRPPFSTASSSIVYPTWINTLSGGLVAQNPSAVGFDYEKVFVFGSDTTIDSLDVAKNQIMMFVANSEHADAGAFRAGIVSGGAWDIRGRASTAFGDSNQAPGECSSVLGGAGNAAHGLRSAIVCGSGSTTLGEYSIVCGGAVHANHADYSAIAGGYQNYISNTSNRSFIGAGQLHTITGVRSAILCGEQCQANAMHTCSVNGFQNIVNGGGSTALNGFNNTINGANCVAAGARTTSDGDYTFIWGDGGSVGTTETTSDQPRRFVIGSTGGIQLGGRLTSETAYPTSTVTPAAGGVVIPVTCDGFLLMYLNDGVSVRQIKVPFFNA